MQCHVAVSRALRGPKPGYIKDLQARIGKSVLLIPEKHSGEIDVSAGDTHLANCIMSESRSRGVHYSGQPATEFNQL